uniref:Uncharacterized protein n=1 Tax=uncultured organism TaxID=155900 RepID=M1Q0W2_9ZZZZ|nr:conserved hypothetical protein, membrane [uncultured organism]
MSKQRFQASVITGIILGIICIIGSGIRVGFKENIIFLFALWYNRFLMGIVFGLISEVEDRMILIRGAVLGFIISFAFYLSTGFQDMIALFAGIVYGIIIEYVASKYKNIY